MDDWIRERIEESVAKESPALKRGLEEAGVRGVDLWWKDMEDVHRIRENVCEYKEQFESVRLEAIYARSLQIGGFDVQMKPYGTKGPDLQISSEGRSIDVEVSRFRRDEVAEEELSEGGDIIGATDASTGEILPWPEVSRMIEEGTFDDKVKKGEIYENKRLVCMPDKSYKIDRKIIEDKARQLCDDMDGIVLLYSSDISTDDIEFKKLKQAWSAGEIRDPEEIPENLAAVIFSDGSAHDMLVNPCARMPAGELECVMEKIMRCLG